MRHIGSLLAGILIAPIAWILIGAATIGLDPNGLYTDAVAKPNGLIAIAMFAAAGIVIGLVAVTRMSPAGPLAIALFFVGLFSFFRFVAKDFGLPEGLETVRVPVQSATAAGDTGVVLAVAALLILTAAVPSRWRGRKRDDDVIDTSELSADRSEPSRSSSSTDAFAPTPAFGNDQPSHGGGNTSYPSVGSGFDNRVIDGYSTQHSSSTTEQPSSPYADDSYDGRDYYGGNGYDQRYGQQQGYGNQQYR